MNTTHKIDCDKFHKSNTNKELIVTQHLWSTNYAPDTELGTGINTNSKVCPSFEELSALQKRQAETNQFNFCEKYY